MEFLTFGSPSETVLIQPADVHDLAGIKSEIALIRDLTQQDFTLIAVKTDRWNDDLSPWQAPPVFGSDGFGGGAAETLAAILPLCADRGRTYYLGGYSLAGLFALWAAYQTDVFAGIAAASPSVWFPGFSAYMQAHPIRTGRVSLSLGDREERARNPVTASVGDCIRADYALLQKQGVPCVLEWNRGNHFTEPDRRTARAFARLMQA